MSFFRRKRRKIKYEPLPAPARPKEENEAVISEDFSLEVVNLFLNNFVSPGDADSVGKLNFREGVKSWELMNSGSPIEVYKNAKYRDNLSDLDVARNATFWRIKRKLENIKNFYPDVYYSDKSIIELWARHNELYKINLEVLDYDRDSPAWLWI